MVSKWSTVFVVTLQVLLTIQNASSAKILVWEAIGTHSTRISIWPLMEELIEKGHDVTFVSIFENLDKPDTKIKSVIPKKFMETIGNWEDKMKFFDLRKNPWNIPKLWYDIMDFSLLGCELMYADEEFSSWLTSNDTKFDLVIAEAIGNDCVYGLVHHWGAKLAVYSTTTVLPYMLDAFGIPDETSSVGDMIFSYPSSHKNPLSFGQRMLNAWNPIVFNLRREWFYHPRMEELTRNVFGLKENELPRFKDIEKNASVIFLSTHYSFSAVRSLPPNVIPVGGAVVSKKPKPLPLDMQKFIDGGKSGFMFISFGTVAEFVNFDDEVQIEFIKALGKFPEMRFVWKSSLPIQHKLPKNVFVAKWAPQQTLLGHPKIKGFISHVGMGSTMEVIHYGVPVVCIPVLADQDLNADVIVDRGAGVKLEILTLKSEELEWAIKEILTNQKYREGMKRLSAIFNDRPRKPLEEAVWYIEYVLRHDNIHEILTHPSAFQPWWKRRQMDVWFMSGLILLALVSVPCYLLLLISKRLLGTSGFEGGQKKLKNN